MNAPTVPPRPLPDDLLTPALIADILDGAAALLDEHGLYEGDWWPMSDGRPDYSPGKPCCTVGAIAVAAGYRCNDDVADVAGVGDVEPHPAVAALMAHLGPMFTTPEALFAWSDNSATAEAVQELRACAAHVRAGATA